MGAESGELKYVWVKVSLFRHDLKDVINVVDTDGDGIVDKTVNQGKQRRQGFEAEMRTIPVCNTTLSTGTTFIDARDRDANEVIKRIPKYTYDIALSYDDLKTFRAVIKGRYVWWNDTALNIRTLYSISMRQKLYTNTRTRILRLS